MVHFVLYIERYHACYHLLHSTIMRPWMSRWSLLRAGGSRCLVSRTFSGYGGLYLLGHGKLPHPIAWACCALCTPVAIINIRKLELFPYHLRVLNTLLGNLQLDTPRVGWAGSAQKGYPSSRGWSCFQEGISFGSTAERQNSVHLTGARSSTEKAESFG